MTATVQVACPEFIAPAENETTPLPALALTVPAGHVVVAEGVPATITLVGSVSTKPMPLCAGLPAPLVMVNVSTEVAPALIAVGANTLFIDACTTAKLAVFDTTPTAGVCAVVTPLVVLGSAALTVALVTSNVTVQVAFTGNVRPPMVIAPVCPAV